MAGAIMQTLLDNAASAVEGSLVLRLLSKRWVQWILSGAMVQTFMSAAAA